VQRFMQAKPAPGLARPSWLVLGDLLGALGEQDSFNLPSDVFARIADSHPAFAGLAYESLGMRGLPVLDASGTRTKTRSGEGLGAGAEATR
jgi:NADH-quinone oxidoreductase subunit G